MADWNADSIVRGEGSIIYIVLCNVYIAISLNISAYIIIQQILMITYGIICSITRRYTITLIYHTQRKDS